MEPDPVRPADPLATLLLQLGVVTGSQVEECRAVKGPACSPIELLRELVAHGYLDAEEAEELGRHLQPSKTVAQVSGPTEARSSDLNAPPMGAVPNAAAPGGPAGRFRILEELGRGGMGVVYKALDTSLGRVVALKGLIAGPMGVPEQMAERFRREALAAAKLRHPGIIQVLEVCEIDGRPHIVMEYVEGRTLQRHLKGHPDGFRESARLLRDVAEAIAHAHREGVIHRDLKPDNILVDFAGKPHVGDFGLARAVDSSETRLTASGAILGTPAYMAPEQAEGNPQSMGPRTDVYGLGAVFYEALTGRPPFTGPGLPQILFAVVHADVVPPSRLNPRVPRDLEVICLKCLEKEPTRRYASARDLALDLARFLSAEAIHARPEAWWERGSRWARRRKVVLVLVGALALASFGGLAAARQARAVERERAQLAERLLKNLREKAGLVVDFALKLRRNGVPMAAAEGYVPLLNTAVDEALRADPHNPEPHYHLGRLLRALMRFQEAHAEQDRALALDPDFAPSLYERAILQGTELGNRLFTLEEKWWGNEGKRFRVSGLLERGGLAESDLGQPPSPEELALSDVQARTSRDALLADLKRLNGRAHATAADGAPAVTAARLLCVQGLLCYHLRNGSKDDPIAMGLLEKALAQDPTLEEAYDALACLRVLAKDEAGAVETLERGLAQDKGYVRFWELLGSSLYVGALRDLRRGIDATQKLTRAESALERAVELDPETIAAWRWRGDLRTEWAQFRADRGEDPRELFGKAEADLNRAIELSARTAEIWTHRGRLRMNWAIVEYQRGEDSRERLRKALADLDRALTLDPASSEAWYCRGMVLTNCGTLSLSIGENPEGSYLGAEANLTQALELNPNDVDSWVVRGTLRQKLALWLAQCGKDFLAKFHAGEADLSRAIELDPQHAETWAARGNLRRSTGEQEAIRSIDPRNSLAASEGDYAKALEINPAQHETWRASGILHAEWSLMADALGETDAVQKWARAEADFASALERNPASAETWSERGRLRGKRCVIGLPPGMNPEEQFAAAETDDTKALELNSEIPVAWHSRAWLRSSWIVDRLSRSQEPQDLWDKADADYGEALRRNSTQSQFWQDRGQHRLNWGIWLGDRGTNPEEVITRALADIDKAIELNPASAAPWICRGAGHTRMALWRAEHALDPQETFAAAEADFGKGLALDPDSVDALSRRGGMRYNWSVYQRDQKAADLPHAPGSVEDFSRALAIDPNRAYELCQRGLVYYLLGHWEEAVADMSAAAKMDPSCEGSCHVELELARARLSQAQNGAGS